MEKEGDMDNVVFQKDETIQMEREGQGQRNKREKY